MKKYIWSMLVTIFLLAGLSSMQSFAAGENEVRLDQDGTVTIISPSAAAEGISSLQFSVMVESENAKEVRFDFSQSNAKITEYRYNENEKKLNVYVAGTEGLFSQDTNTLQMGKVMVLDENGKVVAATASIVADSLQYVGGTVGSTELKVMEDVTVPEPVRINDNGGSTGDDNQGSGSTGGDNTQGSGSAGGDDSRDDDDDDDDDSQDAPSQGTTPSQGGNTQGQRPGNNGQGTGTQIAGNRPQGGNQGTQGTGSGTNGSQATGSNAVNTPAPTAVPTNTPAQTAEPSSSAGSSTGEAGQPSATPDMLPTGSDHQDKTESSGGTNWIWVVVIIIVVLLVGVGAMAVVVLNGKPKSKSGQQDDFYDEGNE